MAQFKNILIVEDDVFISELYIRALKKAGYEVSLAPTGPEGLEMARSGKYDLMLLDIMIPDKTGIEVLTELRDDGSESKEMKIVITTNLEQDDATRNAVEKMADGYIIKADITPNVLVEMIKQIETGGQIPQENKT